MQNRHWSCSVYFANLDVLPLCNEDFWLSIVVFTFFHLFILFAQTRQIPLIDYLSCGGEIVRLFPSINARCVTTTTSVAFSFLFLLIGTIRQNRHQLKSNSNQLNVTWVLFAMIFRSAMAEPSIRFLTQAMKTSYWGKNKEPHFFTCYRKTPHHKIITHADQEGCWLGLRPVPNGSWYYSWKGSHYPLLQLCVLPLCKKSCWVSVSCCPPGKAGQRLLPLSSVRKRWRQGKEKTWWISERSSLSQDDHLNKWPNYRNHWWHYKSQGNKFCSPGAWRQALSLFCLAALVDRKRKGNTPLVMMTQTELCCKYRKKMDWHSFWQRIPHSLGSLTQQHSTTWCSTSVPHAHRERTAKPDLRA